MMTHEEIIAKRDKVLAEREERFCRIWEGSRVLREPSDVPDIPVADTEEKKQYFISRLLSFGAVPKSELIINHTYLGKCRNATKAIWNGEVFIYQRTKFGMTYPEEINHFEDDDGYDVFVPIKDITE